TFGTISSAGLYTAPATVPPLATESVTATSVADTTKSASAAVTLQAPSATPIIVITFPINATTISGIVNVTGTAASAAGVAVVQVSVDTGPFVGASGTTTWTFSLDTKSLINGLHSITAQVTDAAGKTSTSFVKVA